MCQAIIEFCSDSAKPILFSGSFLTLAAALGIGYTAHTSSALTPESLALYYHLQLLVACYLILVTLLGCYVAYSDHKYLTRALSIIASINFVLTIVAIFLIPQGKQLTTLFKGPYYDAVNHYNWTASYPKPPEQTTFQQPNSLPVDKNRSVQSAEDKSRSNDTLLWDSLQERGCCGFENHTNWRNLLPKSCCNSTEVRLRSNGTSGESVYYCEKPGIEHKISCEEIIESDGFHLFIVLCLIALANLYVAVVSGISAYRTLHYNEASQNAYS